MTVQNPGMDLISNAVVFSKYAQYLEDKQRRESWDECTTRNQDMHIRKFPHLEDEIVKAFQLVKDKKVLPSMRTQQFAGRAIEVNNARNFNCSFAAVNDYRVFQEAMFLLLSGVGFGYSVQKHHVDKLPSITVPTRSRRFLVADSIEGWADAVKVLVKAYLRGGSKPRFDFSDIREKGSRLVTSGGKAPGPEPLKKALFLIKCIFQRKEHGSKLTPLECHDIMCHVADAVLAGGIRRSAMIALFSFDDEEMLTCKRGDWYVDNGQRGRANNSAVALRYRITEEAFKKFFKTVQDCQTGDPGLFLTNDPEWGLNPCGEDSLRSNQFCNLTSLVAHHCHTQDQLEELAWAAAFIGTLQASYTDFHYLRPVWQRITEKDALLGVSITGIADSNFLKLDLKKAARVVLDTNRDLAERIGIRPAARTTLVKPEGTGSLVVGSSAGVHAWHNDFYIKRMKLLKNEPLYSFVTQHMPGLIEDDIEKPRLQAQLCVPLRSPDGAITRLDEKPIDLLERVKFVYENWVKPGHRSGANSHAISCTVSLRGDEWPEAVEWMWKNRDAYNCLSVFPYWGGTHKQLPLQDITEERYNEMAQLIKNVDFTEILEEEDATQQAENLACAGGACEVSFL